MKKAIRIRFRYFAFSDVDIRLVREIVKSTAACKVSKFNELTRARVLSERRTTIHPWSSGICIHRETYIRAGNNSKRKVDAGALLRLTQLFRVTRNE